MKQRSLPLLLVLVVSLPVVDFSAAVAPDTAILQTAPAATRMPAAAIDGCPLFPADNVWNARVDTLPVDPHSDDYVATIGADTPLHPDFGADWNGGPFGIPYTTVPGSQPLVALTFDYASESDPAWFELGLLKRSDWKGKWIGAALTGGPRSTIPAPFLRKSFTCIEMNHCGVQRKMTLALERQL